MDANSINGWRNYPTWSFYNWLTAVEGTYRHYQSVAREVLEKCKGDTDKAQADLADILRDCAEAGNPLADDNGLYPDILTWAVGIIDFYEVAEAFLEGVRE